MKYKYTGAYMEINTLTHYKYITNMKQNFEQLCSSQAYGRRRVKKLKCRGNS